MTVLVYTSRRLKVIGRARKRLPPPAIASHIAFKRPPRVKIKRAILYTRWLDVSPPGTGTPPPAPSSIAFKPLRRLRLKRRSTRRPPRLDRYPIAAPSATPVSLVWRALRRFKPHRSRLRHRPSAYPFQFEQVGYSSPRPFYRTRSFVARNRLKTYPVMLAPVRFVPAPKRRALRLHSRPMSRFFRPEHNASFAAAMAQLFFKPARRWRLRKRAVLRVRPHRYPVMRAPAGFVPAKRMLRPRIARLRLAQPLVRHYPFAAPVHIIIPFRRLPRPRIARLHKRTIKVTRVVSFLTQLFTDPRFISTPRPRLLVTTPQPRRLVTTPRVTGVHLPQGRDFSTVDTNEVVTDTFDFGPWLASGITIASISAVSCSVYMGTDGAASSRLVGGASIGASPSSGAASAAVLQQFGNTPIAGVTYRLDVTVVTSDGQTLNLWAHQLVQSPN